MPQKRIGQLGVPLYPAQGLGVSRVEMQPDEGSRDSPVVYRPATVGVACGCACSQCAASVLSSGMAGVLPCMR